MSEANAIVVLFAGALGDFLLALPALRLLRRRHAGTGLVLAVRSVLRELAEHAGCADRVTVLDDRAMAIFLGGGDPPPWWPERTRLVSWFGGDDEAVRARLGACAVAATFLRVVRGEGTVHAACTYAEAIGEPRAWPELLALGGLGLGTLGVASAPGRLLVVHRGAGAAAKRWCPAGFTEVAAWWRRSGGEVVELLGPAEADFRPLPGVDVARNLPLLAVLQVLGRARAYVGNDSGPSHLAAAAGLSGVVVFGPSDPARWRPLSSRLDVVRALPAALRPDGFADPPASSVIGRLRPIDTFWGGD